MAKLNRPFNGWHDESQFSNIKARLLAMSERMDQYYTNDTHINTLPHRIFISHSSDDVKYVSELVTLLYDMGLDETQVFCSSLPGYGIPINKDIFDFLRKQFNEYELHVMIVHSKNYYKSPVCLNEMGAAWVLHNECTSFLLPGFGFEDMKGVVNGNTIAVKLDNPEREVKDKLNQIYGVLAEEFELKKKNETIWETKRDRFIEQIITIKSEKTE